MKWFVAKLVFHIQVNNSSNNTQFDIQLRLIKASSVGDAYFSAREIGIKWATIFTNQNGFIVDWKFIDVVEITQLDELIHGVEIDSNTIIEEEPMD